MGLGHLTSGKFFSNENRTTGFGSPTCYVYFHLEHGGLQKTHSSASGEEKLSWCP